MGVEIFPSWMNLAFMVHGLMVGQAEVDSLGTSQPMWDITRYPRSELREHLVSSRESQPQQFGASVPGRVWPANVGKARAFCPNPATNPTSV